jgi:hypothetical protein
MGAAELFESKYGSTFEHGSTNLRVAEVCAMSLSLGDRMGILGAILGLIALAVTILWPDKKWVGWLSLAGAVVLLIGWGYLELGRELPHLRVQYPTLSVLVVFVIGGCLAAVLWRLTVPTVVPAVPPKTPSLVFVFGAPLGDNDSAQWIMMLKHYGPNLAYNCDINFYDDDRKNIEHEWLVKHPNSPYPPAGLAGESQKRIHIPEAGPEGSLGSFSWNPLDPDSQHYTVSIDCRDGVFVEKWEVTRVNGILRSAITIEHGPQWIEKNPGIESVVFRYQDPEFVRTSLATEMPKVSKGKVVHPGWKPMHRFEVPAAIIDSNGNVQILSGVTLPDGSTLTDFGSWNILSRHFGDNQD